MAWPAWVVPAITAVAGTGLDMLAKRRQRKLNEKYIDQQNQYNTPEAQMKRYKRGGLNPNLIYQQGSSGNQSESVRAPESSPGSTLSSTFNQTRMAQTQEAVGAARIVQSKAMAEVNKVQAEVLRRNPLLNDEAFISTIQSIKKTAEIKASEATSADMQAWYDRATMGHRSDKVHKEVTNLEKQFDLLKLDEKLKAEVLKSKQFQNSIIEIQERFLRDGDIGPQQILEFLKLFLTRLKPR